ncbi:IclR family transcriptional regulator [Actinomadura macra]|uniref:IclR family transcriptional regulator n=1 Tax=Actinomadura macra TaxID=46164 RepID=UPI00082B2CFE|nr:IclR family transcriptional regulator [Actinomadura macra]
MNASGAESPTVLSKVMLILWSFQLDDSAVPLAELVRRTGLHKATVHRLAGEMVANGLLERAAHGYRLNGALFELSMRGSLERSLIEWSGPYLHELLERTHETVHLGILRDLEVVYLIKIGGRGPAAAPSRIGGRMPLHCTAIGKALLAHGTPGLLAQVCAKPLERRTPRTIVAPGILRGQLRRVVETGIAYENEESSVGLVCVAAPILSNRRAVAAISVAGPSYRFRPEQHISTVRRVATELSTIVSAAIDRQ